MVSEFAKPCVVCKRELRNVDSDSINQPHKGTSFISHGHYGSTIFNPMDGSFIELNICDPCIRRLTSESLILFGRDSQLVLCHNTIVGHRKVRRALTDWNGEEDGISSEHKDILEVDVEDIGTDAWDTKDYKVTWHVTREEFSDG